MTHVAAERPEHIQETVEWRESPHVAVKVFCGVQSAELENGAAARFASRQAALLILFRQQIEVGGELFLEVLIERSPAKYGDQPGERFLNVAEHHLLTFICLFLPLSQAHVQ
jgi:hypothetical protein